MNLRRLVDDLREIAGMWRWAPQLRHAIGRSRETLGVLARRQAEQLGDRRLLGFEDESVSYGQFNRGANAYASVLRAAGIRRGDSVALMMENSPDLLMAQAAVAKLGAIGAMVNTHLAGRPLGHVLATSQARHVLVDAPSVERVVECPESASMTIWGLADARALPPRVESLGEALSSASHAEPDPVDVRGHDPFLYIYTSGTTGYPKPAIIRHSRFTMAGIALSGMLGIGRDDVLYAPLPLYHGESNFVGFSVAIRSGATFASRRRFRASAFLDDVCRHRATAFVYVGELCRYLLRQPVSSLDRQHSLRLAVGAGLRPDIWRAFQERFGIARIVEMYGCTEGNVSLMNLRGRVGSVGRSQPFQHGNVKLARYDVAAGDLVRDPGGLLVECGIGEPGELLGKITARGMMPYDGYTDRQASEAKIVRNAFRRGDAYFRTGDILRRDADAYYYFVDRGGDTFRWKGENVSTQEVAEILNGAPGVTESNVYGVSIPGEDGRAGMVAVVLAEGSEFDGRSFYRQSLQIPPYARPWFVRVVPEMATTGTLKQRKVELQREGFDPATVNGPVWVRDDLGETFIELTREMVARLRANGLSPGVVRG